MTEAREKDGTTPSIDPNRDPASGRFLPGNNANPKGRPRGYDFRHIVAEYSARQGVNVEDAVAAIYVAMVGAARNGDVAAAKLLLERLCESPDEIKLSVRHERVDAIGGNISTHDMASEILAATEIARSVLRPIGETTGGSDVVPRLNGSANGSAHA